MIGLQNLSHIELEGQEEISRAIRLSISAELDAVNLYTIIAEGCSDEKVAKVMTSIANEEKVHAGEFIKLLKDINPQEGERWKEGEEEVTDDVKPIGEPYPKDMTIQPIDNFSNSALEGLNEEIDGVLADRKRVRHI